MALTATAPFGMAAGAVYKPELLMVPTVALPLTTSLTFHVTAVLDEPVTLAVNCRVAPTWTLAEVGEMFIETTAVDGVTVTVAVA